MSYYEKIIATFENTLAILNYNNTISPLLRVGESSKHPPPPGRKTLARWTKQIRVSPGMGVEAPLDDGFSWRKYGQKDILGAKFPRGYYRCSHRNVQGCLATKQVQRSDEDPSIFEITYRGNHTCTLASNLPSPLHPRESREQLVNLREGLKLLTHNLDASDQTSFASFLTSTSTSTIKAEEKQDFLSPALQTFGSPATSGTTHFSVSPTSVNDFGFGDHQYLATSGSHAVSASPVNSPTVGSDFPFDNFQFDAHNLTFDDSKFF
ncbi:putative WRKY transcription factor 53 [Senna tora]|uniref:Putative WRKY transcription factor 53 n=1 Tax=Senna tora TaxID=362788 RepID=A0A834WD71_9FABA|nr:putative WRKY transcription factor 53 [Senna tora]